VTKAAAFIIELRPLADASDPDGTRRLRRALKYLLRVCGLRCVSVKSDVKEEGHPTEGGGSFLRYIVATFSTLGSERPYIVRPSSSGEP